MGNFKMNFAQEEVIPFKKTKTGPTIRFVSSDGVPEMDGWLQKCLCYASYYMMTFTAFCVFSPHQVANAAELVLSVIPS